MRTTLDYLFRVEAPYIYVGPGEPERINKFESYFYAREDFPTCTRRLRGRKMRTLEGQMNEFAAAFQFFDGFGENGWALLDCLESMDEWLPAKAYIIIIENGEQLMADDSQKGVEDLLLTLQDAGEWWSKPIEDNGPYNRPAVPFHVQIHVSNRRGAKWITAAAKAKGIPLRL